MWNKNIETFIGLDASFEEASCVIFGAPMDSTTSYRPGTRFASSAIRKNLLVSKPIVLIKIKI